jgi:phosphoribosylformylglycinamidine synthase
MCASHHPGEGAALYEAVEAIGMDLCPRLGISIPVGKDSMSMKMKWTDPAQQGGQGSHFTAVPDCVGIRARVEHPEHLDSTAPPVC